MNQEELCFASIAQVGALYRKRVVSPIEVLEAVLERQQRLEPRLNAFITIMREQARNAARQAERELLAGEDRGPLHGIPLSIKDMFFVQSVRTTCASRLWRDFVPAYDATVVERLRSAGAVLFGKCNMLEFAYGIVHDDYGQCNNPWDTSRTAGGSSSGSASSVAAGIGYGSLGTDTGGSIRIPAAYCGITGLKPTFGRVSRHGVPMLSYSLDHVGTLARSAEDTALLLSAIAGYDERDSWSSRRTVADYPTQLLEPVRGLKVGTLRQQMGDDLVADVRQRVEEAIGLLATLGAQLRDVNVPSLAYADPALFAVCLPEASVINEQLVKEAHEGDFAPLTRDQFAVGSLIPAADYLRGQQLREKLRREFADVFTQVDLVVEPTVAYPAPGADPVFGDADEGSSEARRTGPHNLTGYPSVSVPCGYTREGLPVGLQISGPPFSEGLLLRLAQGIEQASTGLRRRPSL